MNREQASTLIEQTFTHAFDKERFRGFAFELLNHIDEAKAYRCNSQYVKDAFKQHVNRYERLGTYTSPGNEKLDVLIVHLAAESKLERARTAIRNFVADHLKTRDEKDAALAARGETSFRACSPFSCGESDREVGSPWYCVSRHADAAIVDPQCS